MTEISPIKRKRIQQVRSTNYGLYAWQRPNGKFLADTDGNMLNIESEYGDIQKMAEIAKAAAYWGYPDGKPVFIESERCTEEQYQEQINNLLESEA